MDKENIKTDSSNSLINIITAALKVPGVKVDRDAFLNEQFKLYTDEQKKAIIEAGPVVYGCSRKELKDKAGRLVKERTAISAGASFAAGIPGGLAMAATIPADVLQFFGVSLRLAQELAYLYGEGNLWTDGVLDDGRIKNRMVLYIGAMMGISGAAALVRVMSSSFAKQALIELPKMALTKGVIYPIVKNVAKTFGLSMSKQVFARGVSKSIPVIGGFVSGGITFASMYPMGNRLADTFDQANFGYSNDDLETDWKIIDDVCEEEETEIHDAQEKTPADSSEMMDESSAAEKEDNTILSDAWVEKLKKAKELLDDGLITDEEYQTIKSRLIEK